MTGAVALPVQGLVRTLTLALAAWAVFVAAACGPSAEVKQAASERDESVTTEANREAPAGTIEAIGLPAAGADGQATVTPDSGVTAAGKAADPGDGVSSGQGRPPGTDPEPVAAGPNPTATVIPAPTVATAPDEPIAESPAVPVDIPFAQSEPVGRVASEPAKAAEEEEPVETEAAEPEIVTPPGIYGAPEFRGIVQWINSDPLTMKELRGKVVLIDFWTYSCINCQRTLPYIRDWHNKYQEMGLVVVGVHAPEFKFEHKEANVRKAVAEQNVTWAVAMDNGFQTWRAYQNRWWPHKFLIDQKGTIRFHHIGEGAYLETELHIRNLLMEAGVDVSGIQAGGVTGG